MQYKMLSEGFLSGFRQGLHNRAGVCVEGAFDAKPRWRGSARDADLDEDDGPQRDLIAYLEKYLPGDALVHASSLLERCLQGNGDDNDQFPHTRGEEERDDEFAQGAERLARDRRRYGRDQPLPFKGMPRVGAGPGSQDALSAETHLKLAKHFEEMAAKSQNYPDARKKYKELAQQNRQKAEELGREPSQDRRRRAMDGMAFDRQISRRDRARISFIERYPDAARLRSV
jgi:hypothetical protein